VPPRSPADKAKEICTDILRWERQSEALRIAMALGEVLHILRRRSPVISQASLLPPQGPAGRKSQCTAAGQYQKGLGIDGRVALSPFRVKLTQIGWTRSVSRMLTPRTCRAARGLIGITQEELAERAMVGRSTVKNFENGHHRTQTNNLAALKNALEAAGVIFLAAGVHGGEGVRLGSPGDDD